MDGTGASAGRAPRLRAVLDWFSPTSIDPESDPRTWGAYLSAWLYLAGGVIVLATAPLLPPAIDRVPLYVAGAFALATAVITPRLPWHRWPEEALALSTAGAFVLFAVVGLASPGALVAYLPLYSLTFLYLGLTQSRKVIVAAVPVAAISLFVGTGMGRSSAVTATIGIPVWTSLGLALEGFRDRQRRAAEVTEGLLAAAVALGQAGDEAEAAELSASMIQTVLGADIVMVVVREQPSSGRLIVAASRGLGSDADYTTDARAGTDGIVWVLRSGEPLGLRSPEATPFTPEIIDAASVRSALYLPLPGEDGNLGAVAVVWSSRERLGANVVRSGAVLAGEVGKTLERVRDAARLTALADTDPLTNVPNRRRYSRALDAMVPGDAVVLLDLDHFKQVNDVHGHAVGDETLRSFANCLSGVARDIDCVARYGGEEFAMVLAAAGTSGAAAVIDRLRERWLATDPKATFSAGVAEHEDRTSPALTLARADDALYRAKENGRDRIEVADAARRL